MASLIQPTPKNIKPFTNQPTFFTCEVALSFFPAHIWQLDTFASHSHVERKGEHLEDLQVTEIEETQHWMLTR